MDKLLPYQAEDWLSETGCHYGVYATSNWDLALAFALGCVPEKGACSRIITERDWNPVKMVYIRGHPNFGGKGYVYTLLSEGFRNVGGDQWVCDHEVLPVDSTEINVDDYLHLFRYATEEEKNGIK